MRLIFWGFLSLQSPWYFLVTCQFFIQQMVALFILLCYKLLWLYPCWRSRRKTQKGKSPFLSEISHLESFRKLGTLCCCHCHCQMKLLLSVLMSTSEFPKSNLVLPGEKHGKLTPGFVLFSGLVFLSPSATIYFSESLKI